MAVSIGKCRLCLLDHQELQESHFIPAGIYGITRDAEASNPNPLLISPEMYVQTSRQVKDYLFCGDCERLLNDNGEQWMISQCFRSAEGRFPLRERLQGVDPFLSGKGSLGFNTANIRGIEHGKIIYYAMSVYWRAAIHWWRIGRQTITPINLGQYEEKIRRFLRKEEQLDSNVYLSVWLSGREIPNVISSVPTSHCVEGAGIMHRMNIPGIAFVLTIGRKVNDGVKQTCLIHVPGRPMFVSFHVDDELISNLISTVKTSRGAKERKE